MADLTITLTDTELKALKVIALDPQEWVTNAAKHRAGVSIKNICSTLLTHCNENSIALAVGIDAQVTQAHELGLVDEVANIGYTLPGDKE